MRARNMLLVRLVGCVWLKNKTDAIKGTTVKFNAETISHVDTVGETRIKFGYSLFFQDAPFGTSSFGLSVKHFVSSLRSSREASPAADTDWPVLHATFQPISTCHAIISSLSLSLSLSLYNSHLSCSVKS